MILLLFVMSFIVLEAVHEGLAHRGKGTIAGVVETIKLAGVIVMIAWLMHTRFPYYENLYNLLRYAVLSLVLGTGFIRYAIFDFIFNSCAGLPLYHVGTVKLYDRLIRWITKNQAPVLFFWSTRIPALAVGMALIVKI